MNQDLYTRVTQKIADIEAEMKHIGYWSQEPLPEDAYDFRQAFAMDTMAFPRWIQFILIPRVKAVIEQCGQFPSESMVGMQAVREFDGDGNAVRLISHLIGFDELFNK